MKKVNDIRSVDKLLFKIARCSYKYSQRDEILINYKLRLTRDWQAPKDQLYLIRINRKVKNTKVINLFLEYF